MPIELMVLIKHLGWRKLIMSHPSGVRGRLRRQEGRESFQGWTEDGPLLLLGRHRLWVGDGVWLGLTELREDEELLGGGRAVVSAVLVWTGPRHPGDSPRSRAVTSGFCFHTHSETLQSGTAHTTA